MPETCRDIYDNKSQFLHQVGTFHHFHIWCTVTHTSNLFLLVVESRSSTLCSLSCSTHTCHMYFFDLGIMNAASGFIFHLKQLYFCNAICYENWKGHVAVSKGTLISNFVISVHWILSWNLCIDKWIVCPICIRFMCIVQLMCNN